MNRDDNYIDLSSSEEDDDEDEGDDENCMRFSSGETSDADETFEDNEQSNISASQFKMRDDNSDYLMKSHRASNIIYKLINREYSGSLGHHNKRPLLTTVPSRLSFCLRDIVPLNYLQGHVFMGLSVCGQFLLSYNVCCNDNATANQYSYGMGYKYTLYFWIYQPYKPLSSFHKCCLFDDHGVDNLKVVTMVQWKHTDLRTLVIHGASEEENEDSYITYVKVPKLGCLECKKLRDSDDENYFRRYSLCLRCNLTVHTKYSTIETDRKFNPYAHLISPERILIISNGFFHMLHIYIEQGVKQQQQQQQQQQQLSHNYTPISTLKSLMGTERCSTSPSITSDENPSQNSDSGDIQNFQIINNEQIFNCSNNNNIVARILEDFTDIETDSAHSGSGILFTQANQTSSRPYLNTTLQKQLDVPSTELIMQQNCDEFVFNCDPNPSSRIISSTINNSISLPTPSSSSKVMINTKLNNSLITQRSPLKRHQIVTKFFRRGIYTFFSGSSSIGSTNLSNSLSINNTNNNNNNTNNNYNYNNNTNNGNVSINDKAAAYEFIEENEKCEKISIFRKRRLAERKYEFSEDNSENIIPFTKTRSPSRRLKSLFSTAGSTTVRHNPNVNYMHNKSPYISPSTSPHPHQNTNTNPTYDITRHCTPPHCLSPMQHTCSPPLGFRSPPSTSEIINIGTCSANAVSIMRSPNRHLTSANIYYNQKSPPQNYNTNSVYQNILSFKPPGTLSPLQLSIAKRSHWETRSGSMSPNSNPMPFLSPRREDLKLTEVPLQGGTMLDKPICTKIFQRRYIEEDDAASVITSEEDDCISPGYHTLLPMEVHGACYSEMPMISKASYQHLLCTSVVIEQHSFDMETFTYYVITVLCQKNQKTYDFFYDWAYEMISLCPSSHIIFCLLMAQFSCRDDIPSCLSCSRKLNCAFHQRQYECRVLFTWNMVTGEWDVLDYGELYENSLKDIVSETHIKSNQSKYKKFQSITLAKRAKHLARDLCQTLNCFPDYKCNVRVLDSNVKKSKKSIIDYDNMIEFHLKRPRIRN